MNKYEIAAALTLNDMDNFKGRMPAAMQRKVFGYVPFGKKHIEVNCDGQGEVTGYYMTKITQDKVPFQFSFERIAASESVGWLGF